MIGFLRGQVRFVEDDFIILLVGGVGYKVWLSGEDILKCKVDGEVEVFIESVIREDAFDLYGFLSMEAKSLFIKLRSVKGVGPKTSLAILCLGVNEVFSAIKNQDVKFLSKASGLGKKGAERIILELQNILPSTLNLGMKQSLISDNIITGLTNLGYTKKQVTEVLSQLPDNVQKEEEIVKFFLQNI